MKKRYVFAVCLLMAAILLLSAGCAATDEWDSMWNSALRLGEKVDDPQVRQLTEAMIDAIRENDVEAAENIISPDLDRTAVAQVVAQIYPVFADMDVYTLQAANIQRNKNLGTDVTSTSIRYLLAGGKDTPGQLRFYVDVSHSSQQPQHLIGFHVTEYQEVFYTGTVATMDGANAVQWAMLVISMAELAFVIWMFVDCCLHKMEKKWLWLLLTGLAMFSIQLVAGSGQFHVRYNVGWLMSYSMLRLGSDGSVFFQLLLPVGALVYAIIRKKLFADYEKRHAAPVSIPTMPEQSEAPQQQVQPEEPETAADQDQQEN